MHATRNPCPARRTRIPRRLKQLRQCEGRVRSLCTSAARATQPGSATVQLHRGMVIMPRPPKHCGINGCVRIVPAGQRCEQHQHRWGRGNPRTSTPEHRARRARVLARDGGRCQLQYEGICIHRATVCDHIQALGLGGQDTDDNCQAACRPCSARKSSREGHIAQGHRPRP